MNIAEIAKNKIEEIETIQNPRAYDFGWNYGCWMIQEGDMDLEPLLDIDAGRKKSENDDIPEGDYTEMKKHDGIDLSTSSDYWGGYWDAIESIHSGIYAKEEIYDGDREACAGDEGQRNSRGTNGNRRR